MEGSHEDDYSEILPLFIYGDEESATTIYPDMDKVIEKCSKVIERHSIYIKGKEHNRWIDDSYMLIGKARFYKREYFGALEIFEYVDRAFREEPVRAEALTWIARTHMEIDNEVKALLTLEKIDKLRNMDLKYSADFHAVYADYFIREEKYEKAIPKLERAIVLTKRKKDRRRMVYVLAQLYHKLGDYSNASRYYTEVIRLKPNYIMDFNARISRAKAYDVTSNTSEKIKKELNKMLRDGKYEEFYDQVYFALAELAFRESEDSLGISYLKKSASSSVNNTKQKSLAYLKLGHIYFDRTNYITAQAYYDSTSTILEEGHEDYDLVMERLGGLTKLVENINIVENEDSLQRMANMGEKEREKIIYRIIRKIEEEEERKRQELENSFALNYNTGNERNVGGASAGKWYFYNQTTKSLGVTEFYSVWGNRPLEDNWRRLNKKSKQAPGEEDPSATKDTTEGGGLTNKDLEFYLQKLPLTDSSMKVSHNKIIDALFAIGIIYKEDFTDLKKSNTYFERLINDYDTCRHALPTYYHLYRNYTNLNDGQKAAYYKNIILDEYPYTEYARLIKNPSYAKQRRDLSEKIEAFYTATYQLYDYRQYKDVIESCLSAEELFGDNPMKPKFDLLKALAYSKMGNREKFVETLKKIVIDHPTHEVKDKAEEMLEILGNKEESTSSNTASEVKFEDKIEGKHTFVLMLPEGKVDANNIKIKLTDFNSSNFRERKLSVNSVLLDEEYQMVSVKEFDNKEEGLNYYDAFRLNKRELKGVNDKQYKSFIISAENLVILYKAKDINAYESFFEEKYLQ